MKWVDMDLADVPNHFTKAELDSLGFDYDAHLDPQASEYKSETRCHTIIEAYRGVTCTISGDCVQWGSG
jgi:hypothetical protein